MSSYLCVPTNGDPAHWVCDNGKCAQQGRCARHKNVVVMQTDNLWHATSRSSSECAYGCHQVSEPLHHCPRLAAGNIVFGYKLYRNVFAIANSIQPKGSAAAMTMHGPVVRCIKKGPLQLPHELEVLVKSQTTLVVAKIASRQVSGHIIEQYSIVMPNTKTAAPIFPILDSPALILGQVDIELHESITHHPTKGWPPIDGWNFNVLQAMLKSPCARRRWSAISGECHGLGPAKAPSHTKRKLLRPRPLFAAHGTPAVADVCNSTKTTTCAYCKRQFKYFAAFIGTCAPECSSSVNETDSHI